MSDTRTEEAGPEIRVVEVASAEEEVVRAADPEATPEEIKASMSSCVVHLCGCD